MEAEVHGRKAMVGALHCATATGRRLEELRGSFSGSLHLLVRSKHFRYIFLAIPASIVLFWARALFILWGRKARKERQESRLLSSSPGAVDMHGDDPTMADTKRAPFKKKPRWTDLMGWPGSDMFGILAVTVCSYFLALTQVREAQMSAGLYRAQSLNQRLTWFRAALRFPVLFGVQGALWVIQGFFNQRVVLQWRGKVVRRLHALYFSNLAYYRVTSSRKEVRVEDPDIRMCKEVEGVCSAYAGFLLQASSVTFTNAALNSLWNGSPSPGDTEQPGASPLVSKGSKWLGVWLFQALPIVNAFHIPLLVLSYYLTDLVDIIWVQKVRELASSKYHQAITRIQECIGHIRALRGEPYELELLERRLDNVCYWGALSQRAWSGAHYAETLVNSNFGASISCGELAAAMGTCLMIVGRFASGTAAAARRRGDNAAAMPSRAVAELVGGIVMEPRIQITTWVSGTQMVGLLPQLLAAEANASRVLELFARLREANDAAMQMKEVGGEVLEGGDAIAFENVAVETPDGQRLANDLCFRVGLGETLLIVGHNGAGKSSIMRCLCGLWPIRTGKISHPGGKGKQPDGLSLYYLPQKPINVIGSLSDQLTYPDRLPGGLPEAELRRWLRYVGLERLADREPAYDSDGDEASSGNWDELLSLGEQQALSIARLLYHRPHFAVLDECTSAVSKGLERRLFELTRALGIACITIAHRPALQEHHSHMLKLTGMLEQDGLGWQLEALPAAGSAVGTASRPPRLPHCGRGQEAQSRIEAVLEMEDEETSLHIDDPPAERQERPKSESRRIMEDIKTEIQRRWPNVLSRTAALACFGLERRHDRRRIAARSLALLVLAFVRCRLIWECFASICSARRCAFSGDAAGIWTELFRAMFVQPLLTSSEHHFNMQAKALCREMACSTERSLLRRALGHGLALRVLRSAGRGAAPAVGDAMQRIAQVQSLFNEQVLALVKKMLPFSLALYMLPLVAGAGGLRGLAFISAGLACIKACERVAPDRGQVQQRTDELEARFQRLHSRVVRFSEAIAFSGGCEDEQKMLEPNLERLLDHRVQAAKDRLFYDWVKSAFVDRIPDVVQFLLSFNFAQKNIPTGLEAVSPNMACATLVHDSATGTVISAQREVTSVAELLDTLDGRVSRILEVVLAFDAVEAAAPRPAAIGTEVEHGAAPRLQVRGLDLVTSAGARLARKVDFDLAEGLPMLVTGPNGCGKSLLFATLLGVAPQRGGGGHVALHGTGPPERLLMAATQQVYLPLGTLGDQVCYPQAYRQQLGEPGAQEGAMLAALRSTALEHLLTREPRSWLAQRNWEAVLSGGEQQRLALARVFHGRPSFALLDECTSMVASDAEESLYHSLFEEGITPLTLSQRLLMPALYKWELSLGAPTPNGWSLTRLPGDAEAT